MYLQEQEKERVERQRRQNIQLEIDKLTEELLVEKQNIELTKQEEINIANRKQILNSKRKTEAELGKGFLGISALWLTPKVWTPYISEKKPGIESIGWNYYYLEFIYHDYQMSIFP